MNASFDHFQEGKPAQPSWVLILVVLFSSTAFAATENLISGTPADDLISGTDGVDHFFGGPGADTFVVNHLSNSPDQIIDFDSKEGDQIDFSFSHPKLFDMDASQLKLNRRGVITWTPLKGKPLPLIGINDKNVRFVLDKRKNRVLLRIKKKI